MSTSDRPASPTADLGTTTVVIIGAAGQLGRALGATAPGGVVMRGADAPASAPPDSVSVSKVRVVPLTSADIDITDQASVDRALESLAPGDVVINCAAYTDVDGAEEHADDAAAVNSTGPAHLARTVATAQAWLIHVSTDYVFAGAAAGDHSGSPAGDRAGYEPDDISSATPPATVYGATKLAGERAALEADPSATVVRTAWVYTGGADDRDFVGTMRRLERQRDEISVVDDQIGSPTYAPDLARGLWELALDTDRAQVSGRILHATNNGRATWFEVARAVFAEVGADAERVRPCTTAEFPRPAPRPAFSVLSGASWAAAGLTPLREWRTALHAAVAATPGSD
ncbi:dTDP-4-dehydrorhamnose reductase [Gordonia soli]|uniref:dTDP-4-dehydrorhamnose reductase n=1 Tax=Gordonia soli NBRC 108243 TaxID=1223545 RepID=M0QS35_9ACTN|nr:dTDP-4-dehydrorhamnose reductase [Gordonia soli]GAC70757.1 dTDP-6-deoxy-L-lyxo-4-hexulose reductase [Gordonia soli NBRC 108243]